MIGDTEIHVGNVLDEVQQKSLKMLQDNKMNPFRQLLKQVTLPEVKKPQLIVDSGTTYFTAESGVYERVMMLIPPAACNQVTDKTHPPLIYQVKDTAGEVQSFKIKAEEYMVSDENGDHCEPAFMKIDIPKKYGPGLILGEVFMRNFFTVFQRGDGSASDAKIGIARSKKGHATNEALRLLTQGQESFKQSHHGAILAELAHSQATKFHHKPGMNEGSSEIQLKGVTAKAAKNFLK